MNLPATSSTSNPLAPSNWPKDAAPEHWVTGLFEKMARTWGARFLDQWRGVDLEGVKVEWGRALAKLSNAELKAGVGALLTLKFPPTLPEFFGLCKQTRLYESASHTLRLESGGQSTPSVVDAHIAQIGPLLKRLTNPEPTAEWAFKLLRRGMSLSGLPLTYEVRRCATDAMLSSAGRKVLENCADEDREEYTNLYQIARALKLATGQKIWETP